MTVWTDYYTRFNIDPELVRKDCEPKIMLQDPPTEKAIILIHGLSDSPFFMEAIGKRFYQWGYNVFIPLLDGHGLKNLDKFKGFKLETWIENVNFAIQEAQNKYQSKIISIGGLSKGGALSIWKILNSPTEINGGIFLFSTALHLAGKVGKLKETLLRTPIILPIAVFLEDQFGRKLIGEHPYRYSRIDKKGASELSRLIDAIDRQVQKIERNQINKPIFAVHSESDRVADIQGIEQFIALNNPEKTYFFKILKEFQVSHASVVLEFDVRAKTGFILEPKNPLFEEMMNLADEFQKKHCSA